MRNLLIYLLFLPFSAFAQEKADERTFRVLCLSPAADAPEKVQLFDGNVSREINLPRAGLSEVYKLSGAARGVTLLRTPITKPEEIPDGSPAAKLGEGVADFYLLVTRDPANASLPLALQIIDATGEKFRNGEIMWYNLTPFSVGGMLGTQKLAMKGQSRVLVESPASGNAQYDVSLSYIVPEETVFRPICETKWIHDPNSRTLIFVSGGGNKKVPRLESFIDYRESVRKSD